MEQRARQSSDPGRRAPKNGPAGWQPPSHRRAPDRDGSSGGARLRSAGARTTPARGAGLYEPGGKNPARPAFDPPPPPPVYRAAPARGRRPGMLAPLVGLFILAGVWSWRAMASSAAAPLLVETGVGEVSTSGAPAAGVGGHEGKEAPPGSAGANGAGAGEAQAPGGPSAAAGSQSPATGPGAAAAGSGAAAAGDDGTSGFSRTPLWARPYSGGTGTAAPGGPAGTTAGSSGQALTVHVAGAVANPGVYVLAPGARVVDAVTAAGGPADGAALHALNLAAPLADGMRIQVPTQKEAAAGALVPAQGGMPTAGSGMPGAGAAAPGTVPSGSTPHRVDINRATAADLEALPGIGPALAQRIVADREVNGPFRRPQDLTRVTGIGDKTLARLLPYITTGP